MRPRQAQCHILPHIRRPLCQGMASSKRILRPDIHRSRHIHHQDIHRQAGKLGIHHLTQAMRGNTLRRDIRCIRNCNRNRCG